MDPYESKETNNFLTIRQRFLNNMSCLTATEKDLYHNALRLIPTPTITLLDISNYLLDLSYQFHKIAVPILPTTRGSMLLQMATTLRNRSIDILYENVMFLPHYLPPPTPDTLKAYHGKLNINQNPTPMMPPMLHPWIQITKTIEHRPNTQSTENIQQHNVTQNDTIKPPQENESQFSFRHMTHHNPNPLDDIDA